MPADEWAAGSADTSAAQRDLRAAVPAGAGGATRPGGERVVFSFARCFVRGEAEEETLAALSQRLAGVFVGERPVTIP